MRADGTRCGGEFRGNAADRRRRRRWLLHESPWSLADEGFPGWAVCALRLHPDCPQVVDEASLTVDKIEPAWKTYRRENIQPACFDCNRLKWDGPWPSRSGQRRGQKGSGG